MGLLELEHSPLLPIETSHQMSDRWPSYSTIEITTPRSEDPPVPKQILQEVLELCYPTVFTSALEFLPGMVCIMLVGHIDSPKTKQYVDAALMSTMFTNITTFSVGLGLSSALDTLCAQAYGAGKLQRIGIYLQSALLVIGVCLVPMLLLNWYTEVFLLLCAQDPEVAQLAGQFSRITVVGAPFLLVYEMNRKLLQAQNILRPVMGIAMVGNAVNLVAGYVLTYHTPLGFYGAALARVLGHVALVLALVPCYCGHDEYTQWWNGWDLRQACRYSQQFLCLGIPGMLMLIMEWWAYEFLALMAGGLTPDPVLSVSAHAVLCNVATLSYMVYLGISVAGNVCVGNALGANKPRKARLISQVVLSLVLAVACGASALILALRHQLPKLFVVDASAVARAAQCLLVMGPYQLIDGINCVLQGIYRGAGRQHIAAIINGVAFYNVGVPLAALMAFKWKWDVEGLWIGFGAGMLTSICACVSVLGRSSWSELAREAQERTCQSPPAPKHSIV